MVQSRYSNLCIVPEITILTTTHPVEVFSLQQDSSLALPDPPARFIEPPGALIEDSIKDIHLLSHYSANTLALGIPFQDPYVFFFQHQLGLLVSPLIQGFPCFVPSAEAPHKN